MPNFVGSIWNNMTRYAPSAYAAIKQGAGMFGAGFGGMRSGWAGSPSLMGNLASPSFLGRVGGSMSGFGGGIAEAWGGMSTAGKVAGVGMGLGGGWMGTNLIARGLGATVGTLGDLGGVAFGGPAENFQRGRSRGPIGL